jgi:hypothetical protein
MGEPLCGCNEFELSLGPDPSWYLQGLRRAEQEGLIEYARKNTDSQLLASDDYGHICHRYGGAPLLLKYTNTRPLSFIARQILNLYRNDSDVGFLELGPGAGVACATVNRLLPDAKIDTVSLTPLNPYLRFRWDDLWGHIGEQFLHEKCSMRFYSSCSIPFVRNQYIGRFPREISLKKEKYTFIYDNYGAIFYNFHSNEREPMELARASIASSLLALQRNGTMLIMASDGSYRMEDALESIATDMDVIITCKRTTACHIFPCIVAKKDSPLAARLRDSENLLLSKFDRVLQLETRSFEKVIFKISDTRGVECGRGESRGEAEGQRKNNP